MNLNRSADTPAPPYYAVIFTSIRKDEASGYGETAARMATLAMEHPGCYGMESFRNSEGFGVTISYWKDEAAILSWKKDQEHQVAQQRGIKEWYSHYKMRICKVERDYGFDE